MAPIRRYLRISKYSVLECRIFLENPSDKRWLLDPRDQILPRIFATIKPLVLPKLREENERALAKKKSNPVKDVLVEDDFEVAIFLRESGTRHSLLTKQKTFGNQDRITSNSNKLTGRASTHTTHEGILVESDDDEVEVSMDDIPVGDDNANESGNNNDEDGTDDKKLQLTTNYEGFSIWGWTLCLLVTRKGSKAKPATAAAAAAASSGSGQTLMEEWIGTQVQPSLDED